MTIFGVDDPRTTAAVQAYVKLMRATHALTSALEPALLCQGLTTTQLGVLEAVLHRGPMSHRDLGRKVLTSPANITDVVDKLEQRGLVMRTPHDSDRRQVLVQLTSCGRALIETVFPSHAARIGAGMAGLCDAELAQLDALLRKLGHGVADSLAGAPARSHVQAEPFDVER